MKFSASAFRLAALVFAGLGVISGFAQDTRVILLGTGNPNPDPERMGPAVAVVSGGHVYIVDAGPGVVRRAAQAGIKMEQLTRAFITHLHSDHTLGLPDLIFTPAVTGRKTGIEIYGPPGLSCGVPHAGARSRPARRAGRTEETGSLPPTAHGHSTGRHPDRSPGGVWRRNHLRQRPGCHSVRGA